MKAINLLSSDLPEISIITKECINLGQALLFRTPHDQRDGTTYFLLKVGADLYALGERGEVLSMYRPLKHDISINEVVYFSDVEKPRSLSNMSFSLGG